MVPTLANPLPGQGGAVQILKPKQFIRDRWTGADVKSHQRRVLHSNFMQYLADGVRQVERRNQNDTPGLPQPPDPIRSAIRHFSLIYPRHHLPGGSGSGKLSPLPTECSSLSIEHDPDRHASKLSDSPACKIGLLMGGNPRLEDK